MNFFTKTLLGLAACLFTLSTLHSANITIVESQSIHPLHKMDIQWQDIATNLGHNATVVPQSFLTDLNNLNNTDILVVSSGLIDIPAASQQVIIDFVAAGGNLYLQAEYLLDLPGNQTFSGLVNTLGGEFSWEGETSGNLDPMMISGELANNLNPVSSISYYWYGTHGVGSDNIKPFLQFDNKNWGFIYCPIEITAGKVITTSDQDWIRTLDNPALMENILSYLANYNAVDAAPAVTISMTTSSPCEDALTYTFVAEVENSPLSPYNLQWLINGQIVPNATASTFITDAIAEGDVVECRLQMDAECAAFETLSNPILIATVEPLEAPLLSIIADATDICENQEVQFTTDLSTGDALNFSFQWLLNGNSINGANNATFTTSGLNNNDIISCQLNYDNDCDNGLEMVSNNITINVLPTLTPAVTITADQTQICEGDMVTFTANGTDLGTNPVYQWQIDGQNVGDNAPFFTTNTLSAGQNINCNITIEQNLCTTTNEAFSNPLSIEVMPVFQPSINLAASATEICQGESITFTATGDFGSNPTFVWQVDGQTIGNNSNTFTTTTLTNGQQVSCTLNVNNTCATQNSVTTPAIDITVLDGMTPTLLVQASHTQFCYGEEVTFLASGSGHGTSPSYEWFIDGEPQGESLPIFTTSYLHNGQQVSCEVISSSACAMGNATASNIIEVEVTEIEVEVLELAYEHCGNSDGFIEIEAFGGQAPYTYEWMNGTTDSFIDGLAQGKVSVTVTDATGCTGLGQIEMNNLEAPEVSAIETVDAACAGDRGYAAIFLLDSVTTYNYEWTNAEGTVLSQAHQVDHLPVGTYQVVVSNQYGCSTTQEVIIEQTSDLNVTLNADTEINLGESLELDALVNTNEAVTYNWIANQDISCVDCANPTVTPTQSTVYQVEVTNELGCTAIADITVKVGKQRDLFIPNAFTPNNDGNNDTFTVFAGDNVRSIKSMRIFDRWGAELFSQINFQPNQETEGWNGNYRGRVMDTGVYVYAIEVEYIDGSVELHKGDVSLLGK